MNCLQSIVLKRWYQDVLAVKNIFGVLLDPSGPRVPFHLDHTQPFPCADVANKNEEESWCSQAWNARTLFDTNFLTQGRTRRTCVTQQLLGKYYVSTAVVAHHLVST